MPLDDSEVRTLAQVQYSAILYSTGLDALTYVKHGPDTDKASLGRVEIGQRLDAPPPGSKPAFDSGIQTARTYLAPHLVSPARRLIQDGTVELAQSPVTQIPQSPLGTRAAWEQWGLGPKPDFIPWPTVPPSASLVSYDTAGEYPANGACNPSGLAVSSAAPRIARSYKSRPNRARRAIDYQDDDGDVDQYRPSSSRPKQSPKSGNSYACPFRKHDRLKYNLQDRETCASHSWPDMCRLRGHLERCHWGIRCLRCLKLFQHKKHLASHEASRNCQEVKGRYLPPDITAHQQRELNQLKRLQQYSGRRQTDKEKWGEVYRILFPGAPVPSPYFEGIEDVKLVTPERQNGMDFQNFMLRNMPQIFRQTFEARTGRRIEHNEALVLDSVAAESAGKLFQLWKASGHPLPPRLSPGLVPASFGTFPTLPIGAPIMPLLMSEPRPHLGFHAPTTMYPASTAADNVLAAMAPALAFPLDMAGLSQGGDDQGFVNQLSTVPPRDQQLLFLRNDQQSLFAPGDQQTPFLPGNHQIPFWPRDQQLLFLPDHHQSLFTPRDQQSAFLHRDQQAHFMPETHQSLFAPRDQQSAFLHRGQQAHFMPETHQSLFPPRDQQSAFLHRDTQPTFPPLDHQSGFLANGNNFDIPGGGNNFDILGGYDSGYGNGTEYESRQHWQ